MKNTPIHTADNTSLGCIYRDLKMTLTQHRDCLNWIRKDILCLRGSADQERQNGARRYTNHHGQEDTTTLSHLARYWQVVEESLLLAVDTLID